MDQPLWLAASLLLVLGLVCLGWRVRRRLRAELDEARARTQELSALHLATIEALALAIDAKEQMRHHHVRKVQVYATALARAIGMTPGEIEAVWTASLLHDIGKLAVPDHIIAKPGPLTPEELQKVRTHPKVGADILAAVPFPYPVAPIILAHHEHWDGGGYPYGLQGEDIPIGARILRIADYYDALTSERPYHRAMEEAAAVDIIRREAGRALDPSLVEVFLEILPQVAQEADAAEQADAHRRPRGTPTPPVRPPHPAAATVLDNIALAHREIHDLYQIAQAMGTRLGVADTMAIIASKLNAVVPFSACSLFLYDAGTESLHCRFATGTDAELLRSLVVASGQGINGWVARSRRPLVNARPVADLEAAGLPQATRLQSALVCPLVVETRLIGTLGVYHVQPDRYTDDHRRLLDSVCDQASAVIHNSLVFEETQEASFTDPLTGLPNTRYMLRYLARELARAERLQTEVALLVADLNGFKDINDTYGHHIGDRALRAVADALREAIRPYDVCVRYAGDEFILVLSDCGREGAEDKRRELSAAVERIVFEPWPDVAVPLSISVGAAVFPHDGETYEHLMDRADRRMYRHKSRSGQVRRGREAGSRPPLAPGGLQASADVR